MFGRLVFREDKLLSAPMGLRRFTVCHCGVLIRSVFSFDETRPVYWTLGLYYYILNLNNPPQIFNRPFGYNLGMFFCFFFLLCTVIFASLVKNPGLMGNDCPVWSWYFWRTHSRYNNKWAILIISHSSGWRLVVLDLPPSITIRPWLLINPGTSVTC